MAGHIDERTMDELQAKLQQRRAELVREIEESESAPVEDVSEGREPEDEVDLASKEVLGQPVDTIRDKHRRELERVEQALRRIADGSYGTDARGRDIPLDRLRAIPWAMS